MSQLDEIIHQPVRLRIMAALVALHTDTQVGFSYLKEVLEVTDGNLGAHLHKLEEAGYIMLVKTFVNKKPQTYIHATPRGRLAFSDHVQALEEILQSSRPSTRDDNPSKPQLDLAQ